MDDRTPDQDDHVTQAVTQLHTLGLSVDLELVGQVPDPPRELVLEFNHPDKAEPAVFTASGWGDLGAHAAALRMSRARFVRPPDVLDFGCGAGRLLRIIQAFAAHVVAADISARAVSWCGRCPGVSGAVVVPAVPPANQLKTASADWAIANSVFTHIPIVHQAAWLEELGRVLRPGAYLSLTLLGEPHEEMLLTGERRAQLDREGQLEIDAQPAGESGSEGTPLVYGAVFLRPDRWRKVVPESLDMLGRWSRAGHQDIAVLRRRV